MSKQRGTAPARDENTSEEPTDRSGSPTEQEVFDILSNRRRRYALYALLNDDTTTIGSLAERIAAWENDCPVDEVTSTERKRVYTALQQSHLPKLERTGLISFDRCLVGLVVGQIGRSHDDGISSSSIDGVRDCSSESLGPVVIERAETDRQDRHLREDVRGQRRPQVDRRWSAADFAGHLAAEGVECHASPRFGVPPILGVSLGAVVAIA